MTHWLTVLLLLLTWDGFQSVPKPGQAKARPTKNQPRTFNFDAATSEINVTLTQEGLISRRYPTHRVVAKTFTGNIELPKDETKMAASLEAEAKARCPKRTGFLASTIRRLSSIGKAKNKLQDGVIVGASYGLFVHNGTRHQAAQPFLLEAFNEVRKKFAVAVKSLGLSYRTGKSNLG